MSPAKTKPVAPPKRVKVANLGTFRWAPVVDRYLARLPLGGRRVQVEVEVGSAASRPEAVLAKLTKAVGMVERHLETIHLGIAKKLLRQYKDMWNEGGALSESAFARRIKLRSVFVSSRGRATLYFDDGDIFWGYTVMAAISENGVVRSAELVG